MLAGASILLGACYGLLPLVPSHPGWVDSLLFVAGTGQAFFLPLLGTLALGLVGQPKETAPFPLPLSGVE
jgi:hypothetical protein